MCAKRAAGNTPFLYIRHIQRTYIAMAEPTQATRSKDQNLSENRHEKDFPAQRSQAQAHPRISQPNGDQEWPRRYRTSTCQGPQAFGGVSHLTNQTAKTRPLLWLLHSGPVSGCSVPPTTDRFSARLITKAGRKSFCSWPARTSCPNTG